ncbi:hypothetical protein BS78_04G286600 [Paspalum vaginatum]|nr:hypothetical protein BS78_04G286600 [Paspalum vaginatum]
MAHDLVHLTNYRCIFSYEKDTRKAHLSGGSGARKKAGAVDEVSRGGDEGKRWLGFKVEGKRKGSGSRSLGTGSASCTRSTAAAQCAKICCRGALDDPYECFARRTQILFLLASSEGVVHFYSPTAQAPQINRGAI